MDLHVQDNSYELASTFCHPSDMPVTSQACRASALSAKATQRCCVQNFWHRLQNYVHSGCMRLVQVYLTADVNAWIRKTGHSFKHQGASAAVIVVDDWALKYPVALPSKFHVCGFCYFSPEAIEKQSMHGLHTCFMP